MAGREGQEIGVWAFSNCEEVEFFLNGQSQGRNKMTANSHLEWKVKYVPGIFSTKGYKGGKLIAEQKVETTGAPAAINLTSDRATLDAHGRDISMVTVFIVDDKGRTVPIANNAVEFKIEGAGKIIGVGNGNPNTTESDKEPRRKAFNCLAQVIVQAGRQPGTITLTAGSPGLATTSTEFRTAGGEFAPVQP